MTLRGMGEYSVNRNVEFTRRNCLTFEEGPA